MRVRQSKKKRRKAEEKKYISLKNVSGILKTKELLLISLGWHTISRGLAARMPPPPVGAHFVCFPTERSAAPALSFFYFFLVCFFSTSSTCDRSQVGHVMAREASLLPVVVPGRPSLP